MNKDDFELLIKNHSALVEKIVARYCGSREETNDLVSSIWAKTFASADRVQKTEDFPKWIATIAHNSCIDHLRSKRKDVSIEVLSEEETSLEDTALENIAERHNNEALLRSLDMLCEEDKLIIVLHHIKGESVKAISRHLGISTGSVKVKLYRAREKLRDLLFKHGPI